jgi:hypothetical protein
MSELHRLQWSPSVVETAAGHRQRFVSHASRQLARERMRE